MSALSNELKNKQPTCLLMHTVPFESIIFGGGIVESVQKSPTKIFLPAELQQRLEHFGCGTEFSPPPIIVILYHEDRSIIEIKKL